MKKTLFFMTLIAAWCLGLGIDLVRISGEFELHVLDVGQGDGILLVSPEEHHVLIDGGPGSSVLQELGEVMPFLFDEIDLLVLTHPHLDHVEGLIHVLERFEVGAVLLSAPHYDSLVYDAFIQDLDDVPLYFADDDMDFQLGSLRLDVLYPSETLTGKEMSNVNNASPVIMAESDGMRVLLTGDAEQEVEAELLTAGIDLKADILKAGHHGSRTSSTLEFLVAVDPEIMIISSGAGNSFGHPHDETLEKALDLDFELFRTDLDGRISISSDQPLRP